MRGGRTHGTEYWCYVCNGDYILQKRRRKDQTTTFDQFVNLWYLPVLLKDICNIAGILLFSIPSFFFLFFTGDQVSQASSILIGTGAILTYLSILRFLQSFDKFYVRHERMD